MLSFALNSVAVFAVWLLYAILGGLLATGADIVLRRVSRPSSSARRSQSTTVVFKLVAYWASTWLAVSIVAYLLSLADVGLHFVPVIVWAAVQLLGIARSTVNARTRPELADASPFSPGYLFYSFIGQFWGTLAGALMCVIMLLGQSQPNP